MLESRWVDAPLTEAEGQVTPGWQDLHVIDTTTGRTVKDACKVDCDAGLCWRIMVARGHPWLGSYKIVCSPETLAEYGETWKASW